jgi:formate dehydrogenase major subunit
MSLIIDGKNVAFEQGQTILQAALAQGIDIPHLCYDEHLEPYGGCGLCLVEIEGRPKPVRACATEAAEGMVISTRTPALIEAREISMRLLLSDHRGDCRPPCRLACPSEQDCQGYIGLIANGRYAEAIRLIKEDNPLPASIGRICPHPCQDECRRKMKVYVCRPVCDKECDEFCRNHLGGQYLAIAKLKQFAGDWDLSQPVPYQPPMSAKSGKRVAIVGGGPAGLSAAYFLLRLGHDVEIFEAMPKAGGMLRYGIPQYRLPKEVLDQEIGLIEKMGLKINYNQRLGRDITIEGLQKDYDAVFLAIGAWKSSALGCEGEDTPGVCGGLEFLYQVTQDAVSCEGERVAVVGGGNTAMDAARTALRLGAESVEIIYRRTQGEMPAAKWEVEEAIEEGVRIRFLAAPTKVIVENGKAVGLTIQRMKLGEPDASGRPRPVPIEGNIYDADYDRIIAAIGQKVSVDGLEGVELTRRNTICVDETTYASNLPGVFAGGDAVNKGPDIAISAIANGKNAAKVIDSFLAGELKPVKKPYLVTNDKFNERDIPPHKLANRVKYTFLPPMERNQNFDEIVLPYTEYEAQKEASRCLECGCHDYYDCKLLPLLQEYNPQGKVYEGDFHLVARDISQPNIWRNPNKCIQCGLCVKVCRSLLDVEALGYWGRGFDTQLGPAFMDPLKSSNCVACGACAVFCPTGAITTRWPLGKTPPLPTRKEEAVCPYCPEGCLMQLSYYGDWLVDIIPIGGKVCSLGRWGWQLDINGIETRNNPVGPSEEALLEMIYKHLDLYQGELPKVDNLEQFVELLRKLRAKNSK